MNVDRAPYVLTECPSSKRVDDPTLHSTRFDGDDPYTVCVYCGETRDAITGRIIRPATKGSYRTSEEGS